MHTLKIVFVGPKESGKSVIANFLADVTESSEGIYRPTKVVRILEFECPKLQILNNNHPNSGRYVKTDIEIWDVSGDSSYEASWPALSQDAHGVVFVYNPEKGPGSLKALEAFHSHFMSNLSDAQGLVLAFQGKDLGSTTNRGLKLPSLFNHIPQFHVNLKEEGNKFRTDFNAFLSGLLSNMSQRWDQEELNIMNMKT